METVLYVFSATGNSLTTANLLAKELGDCEVIPVASLADARKILVPAKTVGLIYPVYYGNMPYPMREAITKMVFPPESYVFQVATFRGHAGDAAKRCDQLLKTRGMGLSLALGIKMPGNSFINPPEVDAQYLAEQNDRVAELAQAIRERKIEDHSCAEVLRQTPIDYPNNFRGIEAEEPCIGCGLCVSLCPMGNIKIENGRAKIGDDCATCLACFHFCPKKAIWMSKQDNIARREQYHHPDVTAADIAAQKEKREG